MKSTSKARDEYELYEFSRVQCIVGNLKESFIEKAKTGHTYDDVSIDSSNKNIVRRVIGNLRSSGYDVTYPFSLIIKTICNKNMIFFRVTW